MLPNLENKSNICFSVNGIFKPPMKTVVFDGSLKYCNGVLCGNG